MSQQAFILRIAPSRIDRVPEALQSDQIIIGWPRAKGLIEEKLSWKEFRDTVNKQLYNDQENLRKAGATGGHLWRFIKEMNIGDLVVVPHDSGFYVAEIAGPPTYDETKIDEHTAYRRNVKWLNNKKPIPRTYAKAALISRMKVQGTSAYASDLLEEIKECIQIADAGTAPSFEKDLQLKLARETLEAIRSGRMDSFKFENLIKQVLISAGAKEARVIARNKDEGADILATFQIAGAFSLTVAVQAKHWQPEPPVGKEVVDQLILGIEAEGANLGMVITSGSISDEAYSRVEEYFEEKGVKIELVDGEQFAKLIVEQGIKSA